MARCAPLLAAFALAACSASHGIDAGPRDAPLPPLGRCISSCSWDDSCPPEPAMGAPCSTEGAWCAYCRGTSSWDEATIVCRRGVWDYGACGCPCP